MTGFAAVLAAMLLVASMLAVGAGLRVGDFAALLRRPGPLVVALVVNVVVVPALALAAIHVAGLSGQVALGVLLAAAAPGGGSAALLSHHARGDATVAVGLQALLAAVGLVTVPVWTSVGGVDVGVPAGTVAALLAGQLLPLGVGIGVRARWPAAAGRLHGVARRAADGLLVVLVLWYAVGTVERLGDLPAGTVPAIVAVVVVCLVSYWLPATVTRPVRGAVAMTTTIRNLSLAFFVATVTPGAQTTVAVVLTYGLIMYVLAGIALVPMRRAAGSGPASLATAAS
ncbi:hypothetical protein [Micromonospora sp. NPDC050495]|uniref:hypothetical protein n=1 Tax=Micromonospora sp. NPDC050495 TaxID=3154936 RepID=UPI003404012D